MCSPLLSVGLQAYGAFKQANTEKQQATLSTAQQQQQAQLANFNADQAEMYGQINADMVKTISGLNNKITGAVSDTNLGLIGATTDFNIGSIKGVMDFNVSSAEGAARLIEAQAGAEAQAHDANAKIDELQAQNTLEAGNQAERTSRAGHAVVKSQQRASLAANGVALDEGSALRIQSDTDYASDVDADVIKSNAIKGALGYRIQGANETMASRMATLNGAAGAMQKHMDAVAAKINGEVSMTQANLDGAVKAIGTKMSSTFQILQDDMNAQVDAMNILNQSKSDAWAMRAQALGYQGQAAQSRLAARSINPSLMGFTSATAGLSQIAMQAAQMMAGG